MKNMMSSSSSGTWWKDKTIGTLKKNKYFVCKAKLLTMRIAEQWSMFPREAKQRFSRPN